MLRKRGGNASKSVNNARAKRVCGQHVHASAQEQGRHVGDVVHYQPQARADVLRREGARA